MRSTYRRLLRWARTLHIYASMFALVAVLFFAATGLTLNHPDWFGLSEVKRERIEGNLPLGMLTEPLDELKVVEYLRRYHGAAGLVDPLESDGESVRIIFRTPGGMLDVSINRGTGSFAGEKESTGVIGRLNDLHKGKNAGTAWSVVIDALSLLLLFISLTGIVLWLSLKERRALGILGVILGVVSLAAVYFAYVP